MLEYHPQGLFERTGNLWRAQGRRARLELKHFQRQVMTKSLLNPDEVEGWRGEIHDSKVVEQEEQDEQDEQDRDEEGRDAAEEPEESEEDTEAGDEEREHEEASAGRE